MLGFSSIAEYSTGEIPIVAEIPNLFVQIFSEVSVIKVEPLTTLSLDLSYTADEWKIIYYGGNRNTWTVPLETEVLSSFTQKFDFVDTTSLETEATEQIQARYNYPQDDLPLEIADDSLTSTVLNADDIYELGIDAVTDEFPSWLISDKTELTVEPLTLDWNIFLNIDDPIPLSIEVVQKIKDDDVPSAAWNTRPGLPISPISFNSIGIDLFDGGFTSFPDASTGLLDIEASQLLINKRNFPSLGELEFADAATTNTALNDYSTVTKNLAANTFSKEYTLLQQETVSETIPLQINIESYEVYVEYVERGTAGPVQIWIG